MKQAFFFSLLTCVGFSASGQIIPPPTPEVRFPSPNLPPLQGVYVTPAQFHAAYANGIIISNISHRRFTQATPPPPPGGSQVHNFGSIVEFDRVQAGGPVAHAVADAGVAVRVTHVGTQGQMQIFDTEMLQLDIVGGGLPPGARIRESPTRASLGRTTVRPATDGNGFMIDSFFDIFTELSLDGGATWSPAQQPAHVELRRDATTVPPITVPSSLLPPRNDLYITPAQFHLLFANGIVIRDIRHSLFTRSIQPPPPGPPVTHSFGSQVDFQLSTDGGRTFRHGRAPANTVTGLRLRSSDDQTQVFDTEMLALSLQGGDLPPGLMLRESPTRQSLGGTAVGRNPDGTFQIQSFFDIFTEVSLDGGANWTPAAEPARVELVCDAPERPFPTPNLPPPAGQYVSPQRYHALYAQGIILSNVSHRRFTQSQPPPPPGGTQTHEFGSDIDADLSQDGGQSWRRISAPATVVTRVTHVVEADGTAFFDTEMLALDLRGGDLPPGVMVRESPTRASLGRTSMRQVADGTGQIWDYISSFFDVFTELSLDGGQTWSPAEAGPGHVVLDVLPIFPPVQISCPPNQIATTTSPNGAVVFYGTALGFGGCDPVPQVVCNPPSGSTFPVGTTTVVCVASDSCGQSATCSFTVKVRRVKPIFFPTPVLPPPNGVYISPRVFHQLYANGIIIRDIRHRRFTGGLPPPPPGGPPQTHEFGSIVELEHSMDGGVTFQKVSAPAQCAVAVRPRGVIGAAGAGLGGEYDTEMLQLDIAGGSLPPGVMIRESPSKQSLGSTALQPVPGGHMVDSFFDIFTEISLDGGQNWSPAQAAAEVELRVDPRTVEPVPAPTPILPPRNDAYVSPAQFHLLAAQGIVIRDIRHSFFTRSIPPPPPGGTQFHEFGSQLDLQLSTDGGRNFRHARVPAPVVVQVDDLGGGMFDTEMLQLDLAGGDLPPGVMLRESPTLPSRGGVQIDQAADGTYRIGSFFDIFVEVSLDGGQNWLPGQGPGRVELICDAPEQKAPSPNLPPIPGEYISPRRYHQLYAQGIIISNITHRRFTQNQPPPPPGGSQVHQFDSIVDMQFSRDGGASFEPLSVPAGVVVRVTSAQEEGDTRYFDTEMLALDLRGGGLPNGVMVRESPTRASLGRTSIRLVNDPAMGIWDYISSFFDIFTEISLDGGATWSPGSDPGHVVLNIPMVPRVEITCPPDITVVATGAAGAVVNYPPPVAVGGCGPLTVVCNPPSGSTFPIGSTPVTCVARDDCGGSATCVFKIEVRPPVGVIEIDRMDYGLASFTVILPTGAQETVSLAGPSLVHVFFEGAAEGIADDDDGDGLDEVETEMMSMNLVGNSSAGPVSVTLRPGTRSRGQIQETANLLPGRLDVPPFGPAGSTADSFFDIFPEIRLGPLVLHPAQPLRMRGVIRHKPPAPGDTYVNPFTQPVELLDENGNPTGIRIIREVHTPNPEKERDFFSYTQGKINIRHPDGRIERVIVAGPTEVLVCIPPNGAAADTDGDGLDQVPMEMVDLRLLGNSSLGPVMVMLDSDRCRTLGEIEEKVNGTPGTLDIPPFTPPAAGANSSYDLCIKIVVNGRVFRPCGGALVRIASMISHKPPRPGEAYMNLLNQEVPLCDENGNPTGIVLTGEMHTPNPPKEIDFFPNTLARLTVRGPNGAEEDVILTGPTRVVVCIDDIAGSPGYGLAADTDADGRDQVPTEMTLLQLTGVSSMGPVSVRLHPARRSLGEIEETDNLTPGTLDVPPFGPPNSTADSFFDIFTEISIGDQTYTTDGPLHMASRIRHKPPAPGDEYVNPFLQPVELIDANGNPTGIFIVREVHTPNPDCQVGITCPRDIRVLTVNAAGAVVNYPPPVVAGTCPPFTVVCVPPSGSVFPVGMTTVTCTATDRSGKTATCTFKVTVIRRFVEVDKMDFGLAQLTLLKSDNTPEVVTLSGPTTVEAYMDGENDGDATDDDGDGLDEVSAQLVDMDLRGNSSMGPVQVTLNPDVASMGEIEETANNTPGTLDVAPFRPGPANSFFDVFPEIRVGTGAAAMVLRPATALRLQALIRHKPPAPGDTYVNPFTQPVPLLDANGRDTGIRVVREVHTPNPEKEIDVMPFGTAQITITLPNGATETVTLAGPTTVQVCIPPDGTAADSDGDGLDQVPTKMTAMDLRGSSSLGPVRATLDPARMTLGEIEETANGTPGKLDVEPFVPGAPGANSFFDVFTELSLGDLVLRPAQAIRMQALIRHKPPGPDDTYVNPFLQPVPLLDANGRDTGIRIVREVHTPNPPKERDVFSYSLGKINLRLPNGQIERVVVGGPTVVEVCIDDRPGSPNYGRAADLDGDGLDEVPTVMTQLNLMGNSSQGPVMISLDPARPTRGGIEEKVNGTPGVLDLDPFGNRGCANSYFDVHAIIKVGGRLYCTRVPLHIEAMICHKPPRPGEAYMNPINQEPVELVDCVTGQGSGIFLTGEMHTPNLPKERDFFSYSVGKINIRHPNGQIERVIVAGPTLVEVCLDDAPGANQALAADADGDGLDEVPTLMTQLNLMGNSSLGPVMVSLNPARPTTGEIEEKVNGTPGVLDVDPFGNRGCANSFFDVHAIIKVGGRELCPEAPLHIVAMICHKPPLPGEAYMNLINQEIRLLDCASGQPTGFILTGEMHTPNPPKEIDFFPNTVAQLTVRGPTGEEVVTLTGPTRVAVCIDDDPASPSYGLAADTDGDGRDQVPTQMTLLDLVGNSSLGEVRVRLRADRPSNGEIEETANAVPGTLEVPPFGDGTADSFFDIFTEITLRGQTYTTAGPLHMTARIRHKPPAPGDEYVNPFLQPVELIDANGNPTGIFIVREVHTPNPDCRVAIQCPSNIVVWGCSPNGQPVNYPPPTATSSCNLPLVVACVPPSGANFPPGNNAVTCTARDPLGNTASCTFQVRVIHDTTPPVITCPSNIVVTTCRERERVTWSVSATDDCDSTPTVVCQPPSGTVFPIGSHVVTCRAVDDCGNGSGCEFRVEVRRIDPPPQLTITRLADGRLMMCWTATCTEWVVQCTRSLTEPILWETVTIPPTTTGGRNCIILPQGTRHQFYRLIKRDDPPEVYAEDDLMPPQGVYNSPGDELTVILTASAPPRRILARWFVHPVPRPPIIPRPPPCLTCPPETFEFRTDLDFQVSLDEGETWRAVHMITDVAVIAVFEPQPLEAYQMEMVRLDGSTGIAAAADLNPGVRLRESPTRRSLGQHTVRKSAAGDGTYRIGSFFDVFVEVSLDDGQTWGAVQRPVRMELNSNPAPVGARTDAFPPAGTYDSPPVQITRYANGILARRYRHPIQIPPIIPRPPPCLTCPPETYEFQTDLLFEFSVDDGQTWRPGQALSRVGVSSQFQWMAGDTRVYGAEMRRLDAQIPLPGTPGVMLRESPTRKSLGLTSVGDSPSLSQPHRIGSFFDIFTEISLDGGQTWSPSLDATHVVLQPDDVPAAQ
jgi:hypothetical protein